MMIHVYDAAGWCECGVRRLERLELYVDRTGQTVSAPPACTRRERVAPVELVQDRDERRHLTRAAAARKGWETRRHRAFECPQRPLPFKRGTS